MNSVISERLGAEVAGKGCEAPLPRSAMTICRSRPVRSSPWTMAYLALPGGGIVVAHRLQWLPRPYASDETAVSDTRRKTVGAAIDGPGAGNALLPEIEDAVADLVGLLTRGDRDISGSAAPVATEMHFAWSWRESSFPAVDCSRSVVDQLRIMSSQRAQRAEIGLRF